MSLLGKGSIVAHLTRSRGILHQRTELHTVELVGRVVVDDKLDAEGLAAGEQHVESLGIDVAIYEEKKSNMNYLFNFLSKEAKAALAELAIADKAAIAENKITEDAKEKWVEMANTNFEMVQATLNSIAPSAKISKEIANDPANVENAISSGQKK